MKKTPLQQYQRDLNSPGFVDDPIQQKAIKTLNKIYLEVMSQQSWFARVSRFLKTTQSTKGLYMWGQVGSGKTYLMDTFYNCLPVQLKQRAHFHEFMKTVHTRLKELQGRREPLYRIARDFAKDAKVICFDEFFIDDIGDAMILGKLLKHLFALDVILVTTSNIEPDDLYKDGLHRTRFIPTINLLKKHCQVLEVSNQVDYRLQDVATTGNYFTPLDETSEQSMQNSFDYYAHNKSLHGNTIVLGSHSTTAIRCAKGVLWIDFENLCGRPLHVKEYIELAKQFHTIMISNVPVLSSKDNNSAKRFIHAIDIFYEQLVRVIISAAADIDGLYQGKLNAEKFKRTASRLHEMQTKDYLEKTVSRKYSEL